MTGVVTGVVAAYSVPAVAVWGVIGLVLGWLPLSRAALVAMAVYGLVYGAAEITGRPILRAPGTGWQVPQTMLLGARPGRRVLVWGALLGPGLATRNPYAGFGALPLAVAAARGPVAGLAAGAVVGAAHGTARAAALLRDVRELKAQRPPAPVSAGQVRAGQVPTGTVLTAAPRIPTHLDLLLRTVRWRRIDGVLLLGLAVAAAAAAFAAAA